MDAIEYIISRVTSMKERAERLQDEAFDAINDYNLDPNNRSLEIEKQKAAAEFEWEMQNTQPQEKAELFYYALETGAWTDEKVMKIFEEWGYSKEDFEKELATGRYETTSDEEKSYKSKIATSYQNLEERNEKFMDSLEDPDVELILLTQNGIEYIREGYDITGARMIPTPGTYYDMLCTYKDGQYVDCIPYPVFLAKGGDIDRIDSFGELLHTGDYTYEESVQHGTWTRLNEGITALKVGMIIAAATYGEALEERYSYLQPIVDQVDGMDVESPEAEEKISRLVEELEYSVANPENDYAYLDDLEDERVGKQKRKNDRPKEFRRPSGLAHKDAILTQLYDQDKQLGALQPEKSTGKDDKTKPKSEEESK